MLQILIRFNGCVPAIEQQTSDAKRPVTLTMETDAFAKLLSAALVVCAFSDCLVPRREPLFQHGIDDFLDRCQAETDRILARFGAQVIVILSIQRAIRIGSRNAD